MLVERLIAANEVAVFDTMSRDALKHRAISETDRGRIKVYQGNVLDAEAVSAAISEFRPTHVVHCAAIAGVDTVI